MSESSYQNKSSIDQRNSDNIENKGRFYIIAGPSGVGKDTLLLEVKKRLESEGIEVVKPKSYTTRQPRLSDRTDNGYIFVNSAEFAELLKQGAMLECTISHGNQYGMSKKDFENKIQSPGHSIMMKVLDHHGAMLFKRRYPLVTTTIFIRPPSIETLAARLEKRGDRIASENDFQHRMLDSEAEMGLTGEYDYVITNDVLPAASSILYSIVKECTPFINDENDAITTEIEKDLTANNKAEYNTRNISPIITTDRLTIRRYNSTDVNQLHKIFSQNEIDLPIGFTASDQLVDTLRFVVRASRKPFEFVICLRQENGNEKAIGIASLVKSRQHINTDVYTLLCSIATSEQGHGYGVEAIKALIRFAFDQIGLNMISSICDANDKRSVNALKKCGMSDDGIIRHGIMKRDGTVEDLAIFSITR